MAIPANPADRPAAAILPEREPGHVRSWLEADADAPTPGTNAKHRENRPARPRPAVPRLSRAGDRPIPPPIRDIPTVAEANQAIGATPRSRSFERSIREEPREPDGRPGEVWPAGEVHPRSSGVAAPADDAQWPEPAVQPPTLLRPVREDFGTYGSWLDLQSVEPNLAPHLQRACETCRDFRPSEENGERGWCANRDAFTLRTVVNASDLPCISSFGCWWVPFDDVWLSEATIRDHRNPTPLLDQLFSPEEQGIVARQRRRS